MPIFRFTTSGSDVNGGKFSDQKKKGLLNPIAEKLTYKQFIKRTKMAKKQLLRWKLGIREWRIWVEENVGEVIPIGEITFEDLNSADIVKDIDIVFTGKKPAGKEVECLYFKNVEKFETEPYEYSEYSGYGNSNKILSLSRKDNSEIANISDLGVCIPEATKTDITVNLKLESDNAKDWISGKILVYARLRDFIV
jgi:hypothetical protein